MRIKAILAIILIAGAVQSEPFIAENTGVIYKGGHWIDALYSYEFRIRNQSEHPVKGVVIIEACSVGRGWKRVHKENFSLNGQHSKNITFNSQWSPDAMNHDKSYSISEFRITFETAGGAYTTDVEPCRPSYCKTEEGVEEH